MPATLGFGLVDFLDTLRPAIFTRSQGPLRGPFSKMATGQPLEKRKTKAPLRGGQNQTNIMDHYSQVKGSPGAVSSVSDTAKTPFPASSDPSLQDVMGAIANMQASMGQQYEALASKIGTVAIDITLIRADLSKTNERVESLGLKTSSLITDVTDAQAEISNLRSSHDNMARRLEDYVNRARRNNVRLIGVPEDSGTAGADLLVEDLITNHLSPAGLSKFFAVERAHRVPGGKAKPGAPPRPIIARLFHFRDRDAVLQASRDKGPVNFENASVSFYPGFSPLVQKQRLGFQGVKRRLRDLGLKYSLLFPTRLRIEYQERAFFFDCPDNISDWLDSLPMRHERTGHPGGADGGAAE